MYADFDFYRYYYKGKKVKDEDTFDLFSKKASAYIDKITFQRIKEVDENIKYATCNVVDLMVHFSERQGILSEENDGYRVTYSKEENTDLFNAAALFLPIRLLYKGV